MSDPFGPPSRERFLSRNDVASIVGLSLTTIWRLQRAGEFPPFHRISPGRVGLKSTDLDDWFEGKRAGWTK